VNTPIETISWSALEYEHKERSRDWYWALAVIVFASAATSAIFGNYFFALLIVIGGGLLALFSIKQPDTVNYEINDKGIKVSDQLYPYTNIKSFWIDQESPTLFVRTERIFVPIISIQVSPEMMEPIHNIFLEKKVKEEEMAEHPSEKILDKLGF